MTKILLIIITSILFPLFIVSQGFSLNNEDIIKLKKAAISEKTIELIIHKLFVSRTEWSLHTVVIEPDDKVLAVDLVVIVEVGVVVGGGSVV